MPDALTQLRREAACRRDEYQREATQYQERARSIVGITAWSRACTRIGISALLTAASAGAAQWFGGLLAAGQGGLSATAAGVGGRVFGAIFVSGGASMVSGTSDWLISLYRAPLQGNSASGTVRGPAGMAAAAQIFGAGLNEYARAIGSDAAERAMRGARNVDYGAIVGWAARGYPNYADLELKHACESAAPALANAEAWGSAYYGHTVLQEALARALRAVESMGR